MILRSSENQGPRKGRWGVNLLLCLSQIFLGKHLRKSQIYSMEAKINTSVQLTKGMCMLWNQRVIYFLLHRFGRLVSLPPTFRYTNKTCPLLPVSLLKLASTSRSSPTPLKMHALVVSPVINLLKYWWHWCSTPRESWYDEPLNGRFYIM